MWRFRWWILLVVCSLASVPVYAREPVEAEKPSADNKSDDAALLQQLNNRFHRQSPAIGEPLPDLSAFDADGKPFKLRSLKGHYAVLVFGCLT